MAGCVLRATGEIFETGIFLEGSRFEPCNVFCKGERKTKSSVWETSGFTLVVSEADGKDFEQQIKDAITFLKQNKAELLRLRSFVGIEGMSFDFGVYRNNEFIQSYFFPPLLISLAGEAEIALELSIYHNSN